MGVLYPNGTDFVVGMLAAARIGAVVIPFSTFATARELYGDLASDRDNPMIVVSRVATDDDVRDKLRDAIEDLRSAGDRLQGKRTRSSHRASTLLIAARALGASIGWLVGEETSGRQDDDDVFRALSRPGALEILQAFNGFCLGNIELHRRFPDVEIHFPGRPADVTKVCIGHFPGAVHDAAHDGDLHPFEMRRGGLDASGRGLEIKERAAARWAGYVIRFEGAAAGSL